MSNYLLEMLEAITDNTEEQEHLATELFEERITIDDLLDMASGIIYAEYQ